MLDSKILEHPLRTKWCFIHLVQLETCRIDAMAQESCSGGWGPKILRHFRDSFYLLLICINILPWFTVLICLQRT